MVKFLRPMIRMILLSIEIMEKEKEIHAAFVATSRTAKVLATMHGRFLVKMQQC